MASSSPSICFVCCVEAGWLEPGAVRLVESLRRHGERHANAEIFAVTPRPGPPLSRATRAAFARHNVRYVRSFTPTRFGWYNFYNKPLAMVAAERQSTAEIMCWLDSYMIILSALDAIELDDADFVMSSTDKEMGSGGPGDRYEPLWIELCRAVGLTVDDLPWVTTEMDKQRIRLYGNSGIFAYRRQARFGDQYLKFCEDLLDARVISSDPGYRLWINEQAAPGLAVAKLGLKHKSLPRTYNYPLLAISPPEWRSVENLSRAKVLHYHDCMKAETWPTFIAAVRAARPDVAAWLEPLGPMRNGSFLPYKVIGRALKTVRKRREGAYLASCRAVPAPTPPA